MSDKLGPTVAATAVFSSGETPTADKLSVVGAQLKQAALTFEKIFGDAHDQSYPYTTVNSARLSPPHGAALATGNAVGSVLGRPLDIANLARLIGPASNLNPRELAGSHDITETLPAGVREFALRYKPTSSSTFVFSDAAVFATQQATADLLAAAGDYYISADGRVFSYSATTSSTVTYTYDATDGLGGANSRWATFNVIPDPTQIVLGGNGCTVTGPVSGRYTIVTPTVTHQQINAALTSAALDDSDANYNEQLSLPVVITAWYTAGTEIPAGFLYLKDVTDNVAYTDGRYYYVDQYTVEVENADLAAGIAAGHDYALVTVGTDITTSIDDLRMKSKHTHDRTLGEPHVNYTGIAGHLAAATAKGWYSPSTIVGNFAPQYLHRDGYTAADGGTQDNNVMRGDLVLGSTAGVPGTYATDTGESYRLYLGPVATGPYIYKTISQHLSLINPTADILTQSVTGAVQLVAAGNLVGSGAGITMTANGTGSSAYFGNSGTSGSVTVEANDGELAVRANSDDLVIQGAAGGSGPGNNHVHIRIPDAWGGGDAQLKIYDSHLIAGVPEVTSSMTAFRGRVGDTNAHDKVISVEGVLGTHPTNNQTLLDLRWDGLTDPSPKMHYLRFRSDGGTVRGGVRGSDDTDMTTIAAFKAKGQLSEGWAVGNVAKVTLRVDGTEIDNTSGWDTADAGNAQFYSGNADFGEWLPCGDIGEFYSLETEEDLEKLQAACIEAGHMGLEEGSVVWVREREFYAAGPGTPMVVTRRALLVGNSREQQFSDGQGQVLSFCGQLPVLVDGPCKDGDLLVPVPDTATCVAVDADTISFAEYRRAIGTAWGTDENEGLKKITCAVGIK